MDAKKKIKIAPSILAGDFGELREEARRAQMGRADILHVDIMDGHFVPNITVGPQSVAAIRKSTDLPLDVHLMISEPAKYASSFVEGGATNLTFHIEAVQKVVDTIRFIKSLGASCGIALKPRTPFCEVQSVLEQIDMLLIMTVEPGFGGQKFMEDMIPKIEEARNFIDQHRLKVDIEVDGGIDTRTITKVVRAGANVLVAGSAIFGRPDLARAIEDLRSSALSVLSSKSC